MKTVGMICECNPFHAGHEYLIAQAKSRGADAVVCLMSGCFVQRGEPAIADPWARTRALLDGGADVVLELPFPYAAAGADYFADAGVEILSRLGVDELWFGSECGDLDLLSRAARIAESAEFQARYAAQSTAGNEGTAQAFFACLQAVAGDDFMPASNDILGISYLRALLRKGSLMRAVTVARCGSAYREEAILDGEFPSATALRRVWRRNGLDAVAPYLPEGHAAIYRAAEETGFAPADMRHAERMLLGSLRLLSRDAVEQTAELGGGIGNRLRSLAEKASSLDELIALASTKKYPRARLRRGILFASVGVTQDDLRRSISYARLLGANTKGCAFLGVCRRNARIPIVTRHTDLPDTVDAERQAEWETRAYALYTLCFPKVLPADLLWRRTPLIIP